MSGTTVDLQHVSIAWIVFCQLLSQHIASEKIEHNSGDADVL